MATCQASPSHTIHDEVSSLLSEVASDPWGQVSTSVYDTARLVSAVPWLPGHTARIDYLLEKQAPGGSWGARPGYTLVPTLSAVESFLAELSRPTTRQGDRLRDAARRGLAALSRLTDSGTPTPDTIAVEFIAPTLIAMINDRLRTETTNVSVGLSSGELRVPADLAPAPVAALISDIENGRPIPAKLWASLEVLGAAAVAAPFVRPAGGAVAGSPAATAAWLGESPQTSGHAGESAAYLAQLQERGGGAVPAVTPISYFEPAWVLNSLATAGIAYDTPTSLLDRLDGSLGEYGAPAGPGIAADADDTASVLCALARHGRPRRPDALLHYRADEYFVCFPGERTPSTSTNAHVLEAITLYLSDQPAERSPFDGAARTAASWLLSSQLPDGSWLDKWHASPFYATVCCATALAAYGDESYRGALTRTAEWILASQLDDGSWGRWQGTTEETAYAVQTIARLRPVLPHRVDALDIAARKGRDFLFAADDPRTYPALWHAKDLYAPTAVIRAARLAALYAPATATAAGI